MSEGGIGGRIENFSRRVLVPLGLGAILTTAAVSAVDQAKQNPSQDTGLQPNQPGQTEGSPSPTENPWQKETAGKLDGQIPLSKAKGEKIVNEMRVISLGDGAIGPNVRDFPSNLVPPKGLELFPTITNVPVVAILEPGATVNDVLLVQGTYYESNGVKQVRYGAFRAGSVHGNFVDQSRQPVQLDPNRIVVAALPYLQEVPHTVPNSTPTPTP